MLAYREGMVCLENNLLVAAPFCTHPKHLLEEERIVNWNLVIRGSMDDKHIPRELGGFLEGL
ncbi:hypothetical protein D3C71_1970330 [compost metagenome]